MIYGRPYGQKNAEEVILGEIYDNSAYLAKETAIRTDMANGYTITRVKRIRNEEVRTN